MTIPVGARSFADVEQAVIDWLTANGFTSVSVDGPDDRLRDWPHIQVTKIPAGTARLFLDSPSVDIDIFHTSRAAAATAARAVHFWVLRMAGTVVGQQAIDDVRGTTPGYEDYQDPKVFRYLGSYVIDSRPDASPL